MESLDERCGPPTPLAEAAQATRVKDKHETSAGASRCPVANTTGDRSSAGPLTCRRLTNLRDELSDVGLGLFVQALPTKLCLNGLLKQL